MCEHTPGPWYWINQIGGGPALVYGEGDEDGGVVCEAGMTGEGIIVWNEDDARLLAAAPYLLEALEEISFMFASANEVPVERATIKRSSGHYRMMMEAIAKARGR